MKSTLCLVLLLALFSNSCSEDKEIVSVGGLQKDFLESLVQDFRVDSREGQVELVTKAGCKIHLDTERLKLGGEKVEGKIDIEVTEIFDRGSMALSGMHTMSTNGLLSSGGEMLIKAYSGDERVTTDFGYSVDIPADLTGGMQDSMLLFLRLPPNFGSGWDQVIIDGDWLGVFQTEENGQAIYNVRLNSLEWFNCDRYLNYEGPKTTLKVLLPDDHVRGHDHKIYLTVKGEGSALGRVDQSSTYPVGLDVNLVFFMLDPDSDGELLYNIKSAKLTPDFEVKISEDDIQSISVDGLIDEINLLE